MFYEKAINKKAIYNCLLCGLNKKQFSLKSYRINTQTEKL